MTFIRFLVFNVCMLATACMADNAQNEWHGKYDSYVSGGKTAGGSPIMMSIKLKIEKQGSKEFCELHADGFQTNETIFCTTAMNKNQLMILFKSHEDGRIINRSDVEEFKVGETLFSLEKVATKNKKKPVRYITHWGAYTPFGLERKNVKDYFEKLK